MHSAPTVRKLSWKPGNMLSPAPAVLVSCGGTEPWKANLITVAWAGTVCTNPPMVSIAVRPARYSYEIIRSTGEFTLNLPTVREARATDWCGVVSGRDHDKFAETGLTAAPGLHVSCPAVLECPVNIECRVRQTLELGSHVLFIAEVAGVQVSEPLIDRSGKLRLDKAGLLAYVHGAYFTLGHYIGHFGFSVRKHPVPAAGPEARTPRTRRPHESKRRKNKT